MSRARRISLPLWARILAVVVGALVAAQIVTLALTVFFPPAPPSQYSLSDIEAALRGRETRHDRERPLTRTLEAAPPSLDSPGWVVSQAATRDLAKLLGAPESDVRLLFYAPPPLAGAPMAPPRRAENSPAYVLAGMVPPGVGMARPGPGAAFPGALRDPRFARGGFPGVPTSGGFPSPMQGALAARDFRSITRDAGARAAIRRPMTLPSAPLANARPLPGTIAGALPGLPGLPGRGGAGGGPGSAPPVAPGAPFGGPQAIPVPRPRGPIIRTPLDAAVFGVRFSSQTQTANAVSRELPSPSEVEVSTTPPREPSLVVAPAAVEPVPAPKTEPIAPAPRLNIAAPTPVARVEDVSSGRTLAAPSGRFGFAPSAYIEGEFVAALRQADGRWATVRPRPEGFPNSWQRRVMLWFSLSVALVTPLALLFAKRLAAPLKAFAESAERLGREPSADLPPLTGPAEIGVAAEAFNQMQRRIKRYVDDRTGMVRAISHDLRTPLARMRFKLERAPPSLRAAIGRDMDQMEQMIASVLSFMRDEMDGHERQVVDLRSLLEVVVDDAAGPVTLEPGPAVLVEIDVVGIQRVMENLIDNAVKYGFEARLTLETLAGEACVTVADSGPGIPPEELEDVFKAYHRGVQARASGKSGVGLGLVVSRSTVRAHGGELTLRPAERGLIAEVRLPGARTVDAAA